MAYKYNPHTDELDLFSLLKVGISTPTTGKQGDMFLNSTTGQILGHNGVSWEVLHTLTVTTDLLLIDDTDVLLIDDTDSFLI